MLCCFENFFSYFKKTKDWDQGMQDSLLRRIDKK